MKQRSASLQLKEDTERLHRRLDSTSLLADILGPELAADRYAFMLERMALAWDGCLERLSSRIDVGKPGSGWFEADWFLLRRLLDQDLRALGRPQSAGPGRPVPPLAIDPEDSAQVAGLAYVLNGSRLGARIIYQKLSQHADQRIRDATGYFAEAAAADGQHWIKFRQRLDRELTAEAELRIACLAAARTYQVWLDALVVADFDPARELEHA